MNDTIHVAYCVNRKVRTALGVSIHSAVRAVYPDRPIVVWVFHEDLTADDRYELRRIVRPFGEACRLHLRHIDTTMFESLYGLHGEVIPYGKALIPELLREEADRVVYLDADTVVLGGLDDLYDHDLEGHAVGAVSYERLDQALQADFFRKQGLDMEAPAFNSGVMLIDVRRWNDVGLTATVLDTIHAYHDHYQGADQASLNVVLHGRYLPLAIRFNKRASADKRLPDEELDDGILHFVGLPKPWSFGGRWANKNAHVYETLQERAGVTSQKALTVVREEGVLRSLKGLRKVLG